jgi:hypothetical protein
MSSKLGSMGDLTSLFEFSPAPVDVASADAPQPLPLPLPLADAGAAAGLAGKSLPRAADCGVDTPPLSSCSEGELLCVPDMARVPKRRRT